ncbi:Pre-mRNA-splicing factor CWC21 [Sugiyamaella lignohabitans]|uniref:Pre-mRNA-splicing factor CWC21 n=1 Tax=Sugiyamaella lignohabitans TaxID=796027 RepID=A0A167CGF2_9ASCO|nr:Pre-mRNA-splicing factor CWC21 [Sugiyamaella lignohabitans]ANB11654.1 Pre-mRNA-splicing factor CWC21 [Sugiyamaella lignohabitans]
MSYNGIGLKTARGSGTNGYIQKSSATERFSEGVYAHRQRQQARYERDQRIWASTNIADRYVDQGIIEHDRKRQVEVKCCELRDKLEEAGDIAEDEIEKQVSDLRKELHEKLKKDGQLDGSKLASTHEVAEAKAALNERLQTAINQASTKKVYGSSSRVRRGERGDDRSEPAGHRRDGRNGPDDRGHSKRSDRDDDRRAGHSRSQRGGERWGREGREKEWKADDYDDYKESRRSYDRRGRSRSQSRSRSPSRSPPASSGRGHSSRRARSRSPERRRWSRSPQRRSRRYESVSRSPPPRSRRRSNSPSKETRSKSPQN